MTQVRIEVSGVELDGLSMEDALAVISDRVRSGEGGHVVTANVDHLVQLRRDAEFARAYRSAFLRLVDGAPVEWLTALLGTRAPRVPGSDLVPALCGRAAAEGWNVVIAGGAHGVAELAADRLRRSVPGLKIVGHELGDIDERAQGRDATDEARAVARRDPDLLLVGLGAPKQELWAWRHAAFLERSVVVCCGAAVDFAAGTARRAPELYRRLGFEWLFRLSNDFRTLWKRYLWRDAAFVFIVLRALWKRYGMRQPASRREPREREPSASPALRPGDLGLGPRGEGAALPYVDEYYRRTYGASLSRRLPRLSRESYWARWLAARLESRAEPVIDLGAGLGWFSDCARKRGLAVVGVDLSLFSATCLREREVPAIVASAGLQPLRTQSCGAVVALDVLEHLADVGEALHEIRRVLRPTGMLILSVPNTGGIGAHSKRPGGSWFADADATHHSLLSPQEWLARLNDSGLRVERLGSDGLWDVPYPVPVPPIVQRGTLLPLHRLMSGALGSVRWQHGENLVVVATPA